MIDVVTALLAVALLLPFRIPQPQPDRTQRWSLWGDFVAGVQVVTKHRGLLALYAVVTLMVMLIMLDFNLIPLFVHSHFAGDVNQVALMPRVQAMQSPCVWSGAERSRVPDLCALRAAFELNRTTDVFRNDGELGIVMAAGRDP